MARLAVGGKEGEVEEEEKEVGVIGHGEREIGGRLIVALARGAGRLIGSSLPRGSGRGEIGGGLVSGVGKKKRIGRRLPGGAAMIGDAATNVSRQGPVGALRGPWGPRAR